MVKLYVIKKKYLVIDESTTNKSLTFIIFWWWSPLCSPPFLFYFFFYMLVSRQNILPHFNGHFRIGLLRIFFYILLGYFFLFSNKKRHSVLPFGYWFGSVFFYFLICYLFIFFIALFHQLIYVNFLIFFFLISDIFLFISLVSLWQQISVIFLQFLNHCNKFSYILFSISFFRSPMLHFLFIL